MTVPDLKEGKFEIATPDGPMNAFMAAPDGERSKGRVQAVVVVQEAFGVNSHIEEVCRRLAREGYLAVAPEFFHRAGKGLTFAYDEYPKIKPIFEKLGNAQIAMDVQATLAFLEKKHGVSASACAVIGFCLGGFAAMIAATRLPIATAIAYYGGGMVEARPGMALSPILEDFKSIHCPVLLFFGEQDQAIPMNQVRAVEAELKAQRKTFEVIVYPEAGHGFSNDERSSYHPESAKAAWKESLAWLKRIQ